MNSGRGPSLFDTGPPELRLDVGCTGTPADGVESTVEVAGTLCEVASSRCRVFGLGSQRRTGDNPIRRLGTIPFVAWSRVDEGHCFRGGLPTVALLAVMAGVLVVDEMAGDGDVTAALHSRFTDSGESDTAAFRSCRSGLAGGTNGP